MINHNTSLKVNNSKEWTVVSATYSNNSDLDVSDNIVFSIIKS